MTRNDEFVRYEGAITTGQAGNYELVCSATKLTVVAIDGKRVISMIFPYTNHYRDNGAGKAEIKSIFLTQGPHSLQITTPTQYANTLPNISWRHGGDKNPGIPIWNSFTWP